MTQSAGAGFCRGRQPELTIPFCPVEETMSGRQGMWLLTIAMALVSVSGGRKELRPSLQHDSDVAQDPCRSAPAVLPCCVQISTAAMTKCSQLPAFPPFNVRQKCIGQRPTCSCLLCPHANVLVLQPPVRSGCAARPAMPAVALSLCRPAALCRPATLCHTAAATLLDWRMHSPTMG